MVFTIFAIYFLRASYVLFNSYGDQLGVSLMSYDEYGNLKPSLFENVKHFVILLISDGVRTCRYPNRYSVIRLV